MDEDDEFQIHESTVQLPLNSLRNYGLPSTVVEAYESNGVKTLFNWQAEILNKKEVLQAGNLVYSAPTGGGKTMVAEILLIRKILKTRKKALFVLPFVSIVVEKVAYFKKLYKKAKLNVVAFHGDNGSSRLSSACHIAVCTIEKANSIVNKLIGEKRLHTIGIVVIDEMHLIQDEQRGYILELLLTKIRFYQERYSHKIPEKIEHAVGGDVLREQHSTPVRDEVKLPEVEVQIVGLSATLPNLDVVAKWLNGIEFVSKFRPVELKEYVKIDRELFGADNKRKRKIPEIKKKITIKDDPSQIVTLCNEVVSKGMSVLIFCHSKAKCQIEGNHIAKYLPRMRLYKGGEKLKKQLQKKREKLLEDLKKSKFGLEPDLGNMISAGVAYHHAGLTVYERAHVENAFRDGTIQVLTATSTLAAGVNLPARRVIFQSLKIGISVLNISRYKQMAGRAGRQGKETFGESIMLAKENERELALELMNGALPPIKSCLSLEGKGLSRILLEGMASGIVKTNEDIRSFVKCTLIYAQASSDMEEKIWDNVDQSLKLLLDSEFVEKTRKNIFRPTKLGFATFKSGMDPETALTVYNDLERCQQMSIIGDDLQLVYQISPIKYFPLKNFSSLADYLRSMRGVKKDIINQLGISDKILRKWAVNPPSGYSDRMKEEVRIARRIFIAMCLQALCKNVPLAKVAKDYKIEKGVLFSHMHSAKGFAAMVCIFAKELDWWNMRLFLTPYCDWLKFKMPKRLQRLGKIDEMITRPIAEILYKNGVKEAKGLSEIDAELLAEYIERCDTYDEKKRERGPKCLIYARSLIRSARLYLDNEKKSLKRKVKEKKVELKDAELPAKQRQKLYHTPKPDAKAWDLDDGNIEPDVEIVKVKKRKRENDKEDMKQKKKIAVESVNNAVLKKPAVEKKTESAERIQVKRMRSVSRTPNVDSEDELIAPRKRRRLNSNASTPVLKLIDSDEEESRGSVDRLCVVDCTRELSEATPERSFHCSQVPDSPLVIDVFHTEARCEKFFKEWAAVEQFSWSVWGRNHDENINDVELSYRKTNSEIPKQFSRSKIGGFAICWSNGEVYVMELNHNVRKCPQHISKPQIWDHISQIFCNDAVKTSFNTKHLLKVLFRVGIEVQGELRDPTVADWMLNPDESHDPCVRKMFVDYAQQESAQSLHESVETDPPAFASLSTSSRVHAVHAWRTRVVMAGIVIELEKKQLTKSFRDVEMPITRVLHEMEIFGAGFNWDPADHWKENVETRLTYLAKVAERLNDGVSINLNAKNLRPFIRKLGVDCPPKENGKESIARKEIDALIRKDAHWFLESIVEYRSLLKFRSSFLGPIPRTARWNTVFRMGRIPTNYKQCAVSTGRLSMHRPNLQCVATSVDLKAAPRLSVWEEIQQEKGSSALEDMVLRHGCNEENDDLSCIVIKTDSCFCEASLISINSDIPISKPAKGMKEPLVDWWREHDFTYTDEQAKKIFQVQVKLKKRKHILSFPADKVWRKRAFNFNFLEPNSSDVLEGYPFKDETLKPRVVFTSSAGSVLLSADYSQFELRVLAHFAKDKNLVSDIKEGNDVMRTVAAEWKNKSIDDVTKEERNRIKRIVYGVIYGRGAKSMAAELDIPIADAEGMRDGFFERYPGVRDYMDKALKDCERDGFIKTVYQRRRYLENIDAANFKERAKAQRQVLSSICQGSAADIIKVAMVQIMKEFHILNKDRDSPQALMVLQIHDELVFEVERSILPRITNMVVRHMERDVHLEVPLKVRLKLGTDWGNMKEISVEEIQNMKVVAEN